MRVTRLYYPDALACGESVQLDSQASSHLVRVLRSPAGTPLVLFNGDGFNYRAMTLDADPRKTSVLVEDKVPANNESPLKITLLQGLSRQDRMESTIQKSVELGVNRIIPVICQRSNTRLNADKLNKKQQHWQRVAISACQQCGRAVIPQVLPALPLSELPSLLEPQAHRYTLLPEAERSLGEQPETPVYIEVLIGPEGGLSDEEAGFLCEHNFTAVKFGPRILRTETAGPAVISAMQLLWGDF